MNTSSKKTVLATVLGIASGIAVTIMVNNLGGIDDHLKISFRDNQTDESFNVQLKDEKLNSLIQLNEQQIRHQDNKIQSLERKLSSFTALISTDKVSEEAREVETQAAELSEMTPEEAKAQDLEWWENMKAVFEHETIDKNWSEATNSDFVLDIAELANEKGFAVIHTECRTTQCKAILEWPSYDEASIGFSELLHHEYNANCARYTLLPEPIDDQSDKPYEMTIIFDCSELREKA